MMESGDVTYHGDRDENDQLNSAFPLFKGEAYDFFFEKSPWKLGLQSTYPNQLKQKIAAVLIAEQLGLKSLDHSFNAYASSIIYPDGDPERLDLRALRFVNARMDGFNRLLSILSPGTELKGNTILGLLALQRAEFSMQFLAFCAHRGALFEAVAIARMMLEQVAWAYSVHLADDERAVHSLSAPHAINVLKNEVAFVGKLYGWFSAHVHWEPHAHRKVVVSFGAGALGHQYASTYFKALSISVMILLVQAYFECLWAIAREHLQVCAGQLIEGPCFPEDVRVGAKELLAEISGCDPDDPELFKLAEMLSN